MCGRIGLSYKGGGTDDIFVGEDFEYEHEHGEEMEEVSNHLEDVHGRVLNLKPFLNFIINGLVIILNYKRVIYSLSTI